MVNIKYENSKVVKSCFRIVTLRTFSITEARKRLLMKSNELYNFRAIDYLIIFFLHGLLRLG